MHSEQVHAKFTDFTLPSSIEPRQATVALPVSNGVQQRYFFMNMQTMKGLRVDYPRRGGLTTKEALQYVEHLCTFAMNPSHFLFPRLRVAFRRFHNGISSSRCSSRCSSRTASPTSASSGGWFRCGRPASTSSST